MLLKSHIDIPMKKSLHNHPEPHISDLALIIQNTYGKFDMALLFKFKNINTHNVFFFYSPL